MARTLVIYLKRPGGQNQYSSPLRIQYQAADQFGHLLSWILANLAADLSVGVLARKVDMSRRQFSRVFTERFGEPPARLVQVLRLDEARQLLAESEGTIRHVAAAVGFQSVDVFRRAFEKRFQLSPKAYRATIRSAC